MRPIIKISFLHCCLFLLSSSTVAQYSATSTHLTSTPIESESTMRMSAGLSLAPNLKSELEAGFLFALGSGFETGCGIHGGNSIFDNSGVMGFDIAARYFIHPNSSIALGVLTQFGLTYTGIGDIHTEPEYGVALPITLSLSMGAQVAKETQIYVVPALELGQTMRGGDVVWKSGIGLRTTIGVAITLSPQIKLVMETRPSISKFDSGRLSDNFRLESGFGFVFDV